MRALLTACTLLVLASACSKKKTDPEGDTPSASASASLAATPPEGPPPPPPPHPPPPFPSATTASDVADAAPDPTPLVVLAMRLVSTDPKATEKPLDLKADGSILIGKDVIAKVVGSHVEDLQGKALVETANGAVTFRGKPDKARFDANDAIVERDGKIAVGDDGTITLTDPRGKAEKAPAKWVGFKPQARRVAVLVTALLDALPNEMQPRAAGAPATAAAATATPTATTTPSNTVVTVPATGASTFGRTFIPPLQRRQRSGATTPQ